MTLKFLKTDWLLAIKFLLNIIETKTYASIFFSSLQLIWLIIGIDTELERHSPKNATKNIWNQYD